MTLPSDEHNGAVKIQDDTIFRLRAPCRQCGATGGKLVETNGQNCVYCTNGHFCYNAPRHELGQAPVPVRSSPIAPAVRYIVAARAGFRCEFCRRQERETTMHVGHLVSEKDIRTYGVPLRFADHVDNLVWLCQECNLGQGAQSLTLHALLVFLITRQLAAERVENA